MVNSVVFRNQSQSQPMGFQEFFSRGSPPSAFTPSGGGVAGFPRSGGGGSRAAQAQQQSQAAQAAQAAQAQQQSQAAQAAQAAQAEQDRLSETLSDAQKTLLSAQKKEEFKKIIEKSTNDEINRADVGSRGLSPIERYRLKQEAGLKAKKTELDYKEQLLTNQGEVLKRLQNAGALQQGVVFKYQADVRALQQEQVSNNAQIYGYNVSLLRKDVRSGGGSNVTIQASEKAFDFGQEQKSKIITPEGTIYTNASGTLSKANFGAFPVETERSRQFLQKGFDNLKFRAIEETIAKTGEFAGGTIYDLQTGLPQIKRKRKPTIFGVSMQNEEQKKETFVGLGRIAAEVGTLFLPGPFGKARVAIAFGAEPSIEGLASGATFVTAVAGAERFFVLGQAGIKKGILAKGLKAVEKFIGLGIPTAMVLQTIPELPLAIKSRQESMRLSGDIASFFIGGKVGEVFGGSIIRRATTPALRQIEFREAKFFIEKKYGKESPKVSEFTVAYKRAFEELPRNVPIQKDISASVRLLASLKGEPKAQEALSRSLKKFGKQEDIFLIGSGTILPQTRLKTLAKERGGLGDLDITVLGEEGARTLRNISAKGLIEAGYKSKIEKRQSKNEFGKKYSIRFGGEQLINISSNLKPTKLQLERFISGPFDFPEFPTTAFVKAESGINLFRLREQARAKVSAAYIQRKSRAVKDIPDVLAIVGATQEYAKKPMQFGLIELPNFFGLEQRAQLGLFGGQRPFEPKINKIQDFFESIRKEKKTGKEYDYLKPESYFSKIKAPTSYQYLKPKTGSYLFGTLSGQPKIVSTTPNYYPLKTQGGYVYPSFPISGYPSSVPPKPILPYRYLPYPSKQFQSLYSIPPAKPTPYKQKYPYKPIYPIPPYKYTPRPSPPPTRPPSNPPSSYKPFPSYKPIQEFFSGFNVFVRRKGKFVKASAEPLTEKSAIGLGQLITTGNSTRTFFIEQTGGQGKRIESYENTNLAYQFRRPIGRSRLPRQSFVELSKYAINRAGEKAEITRKGIAARRGKRKGGKRHGFF